LDVGFGLRVLGSSYGLGSGGENLRQGTVGCLVSRVCADGWSGGVQYVHGPSAVQWFRMPSSCATDTPSTVRTHRANKHASHGIWYERQKH